MVSQVVTPKVDQRTGKRQSRYEARRVLWDVTTNKRLRNCGRAVTNNGTGVTVLASGSGSERRAGFAGVQSCGSVHVCPVDSEKINKHRQTEIESALNTWAADGGSIGFLTLTMKHRKGQSLRSLWAGVSQAWHSTMSGRQYGAEKGVYGIVGYTRVIEVTHGASGWHVHVHALLFLLDNLLENVSHADQLEASIYSRWHAALHRRGFTAARKVNGQSIGCRLDFIKNGQPDSDARLAKYVTKSNYAAAAFEVTGSHEKQGRGGNRTPFQILADFVATGDADDLDLWHEWERSSKGKRQLTWSQGLRKIVQLCEVEKTDEEIAEEALGGDEVGYIPRELFVQLANTGWTAHVLTLAEADEDGSTLRAWLQQWE